MTYRWREHVGHKEDFDGIRRDRAEAEVWFEKDPIRLIASRLDEKIRQEILTEVDVQIEEAFAFAEASAFPGPEELYKDIFKES
jgi:pyruvate dehydrogenase E1 component alpha subunit